MARFAGDRTGAVFEPLTLGSAGARSDFSGAAGVVNLGESFSAMRDKAPKFDTLSAEAMKNQAAEKITGIEAMGQTVSYGLNALGQTKGAALTAEGQIKAAEKAAEASKQSSMFSGIGGVVSMGIKALSGGFA